MFSSFPGPYAPAILRFHIVFPSRYPNSPPLLTFTTDIFHPLVSPSTTYTHASGSLTSGASIADGELSSPGGFNLRHGFPAWFRKEEEIDLETSKDVKISTAVKTEDGLASAKDEQSRSPSVKVLQESGTVGTVPASNKAQKEVQKPSPRTIFKILQYLKQAFEDENLLDELPFNAAANPGAWKAWRAHRVNTVPSSDRHKMDVPSNTPQRTLGEGSTVKPSNDWSWSGIWEQRVGEGIESSMSDPVLYGSTDNDDLVCVRRVHVIVGVLTIILDRFHGSRR